MGSLSSRGFTAPRLAYVSRALYLAASWITGAFDSSAVKRHRHVVIRALQFEFNYPDGALESRRNEEVGTKDVDCAERRRVTQLFHARGARTSRGNSQPQSVSKGRNC